MKIAICGSMAFAKEMTDTKEKLEKLGHKVVIPKGADKYADGTFNVETKWGKIEFDVIKSYYKEIKKSDAIVILNKDKNNIQNYIGGNSLIEMAFAHILDKKIFLLNPIPRMSYADEISAMKPNVLNGNLNKIQ